ncbi:hypothetical protein DQ04_02741030 [Trypanosoma grayi]|uniref:hypothetical protein n=1 Tax=Trypanosoma grayi TaxID=71804 RepID=UPI0004F438AF|nr:hypothetical protein DQ04_02741030 [Trypanosoma grayi]KEG11318.1 hypothetical protein DQ04_02741030 [Trypanosoma grayi]
MSISEKACLRIRVTLYVVFALSYAIGVFIFLSHFKNYLAAFGFGAAIAFIAWTTVLYLVPDAKLYRAFSPGSAMRIIFQSGVLIGTLAFFCASIYALAEGIKLRETWKGESHFCSFIALLTASKWCFFCGLRVHRVCEPSIKGKMDEDDDDDDVENANLFENCYDLEFEEENKLNV